MSKLFSPHQVGPFTLKNRVVMAPMTRSRASSAHIPTPLMAPYYAQRADGGLLITEGTAPAPDGAGYARIPGLWSQEQVEAWKPITQAVHERGGHIAVQLMHTGRVGHPLNLPSGARVVGPSKNGVSGQMYTDQEGPKDYPVAEEMSEADIVSAVASFGAAAKNASAAGFDLVEIHGANGYLVDQFLAPNVNQRSDKWGGSFQARARFALEVARATAKAIGADRVGIRLSPFGAFNGIEPWQGAAEDYVWLAGELGRLGLAYLHVVDHSSMGAPTLPADLKSNMRAAFGGTFVLSGGYSEKQRAEADLVENKGELVAFGRPYLANPDLVERLKVGAPLNPPDMSTFYTPGDKGYTDYPFLSGASV